MNAREQGRRSVRSLTATLALSGVTVVGALSIVAYTGIQTSRAATTSTTSSDQGTPVQRDHDAPAESVPTSAAAAAGSSSTSSGSGLGAGSGSSHTASSGS